VGEGEGDGEGDGDGAETCDSFCANDENVDGGRQKAASRKT